MSPPPVAGHADLIPASNAPSFPAHDTGGGNLVSCTDVTESKQREQEVRLSEARLRALFEYAAIGIAVLDPGGRFIKANAALEAMLGYRSDDLRHFTHNALVVDDDREAELCQARRLAAGETDHYNLEHRYMRRDGTYFWGRLTASTIWSQDHEHLIIAMVENIDDRKRTEKELALFRAIVEESHEAIAVVAARGGRVTYANPAHERLFKRSVRDGSAIAYHEYYQPDAVAVIDRELGPALRRGGSWEGVLDARDAEGRGFPMWQRAGVVRAANGKPDFYFAFMHDHSRQKQEEGELYRAKETAEQANQAKTRFLAAASHDLRQPLQALAMFVAVLSSREHSPSNRVIVDRIQDSLSAVEGLLNSLLDVSKLEAGLVVPTLECFPVGPMLQRLEAEFEPLTQAAGLELRMVPCRAGIRSDPSLLERILRNLLNNAARYTKSGRILFGCRRCGDRLRIEVWDTGVGIPKSQIKLIFREFHQLGNPNRDRRQGLGLGLAIVERLAALLDHRVTVDSRPHKGSVFAIEVPLIHAQFECPPPRQLSLRMGGSNAFIVVIDDEPDVLESIRLLLESWGYEVVTATNCEDALSQMPARRRVPDLIIADYRLQNGSTGGQAIARMQVRLRVPIPAIILTGDTAPERLRQARASGHGLLHKPVQAASLQTAIDAILNGRPKGRVLRS